MPSAWSVTVLKTVNHLSSLSSSLNTCISFCTASHSDVIAACFRKISVSSLDPSSANVGVFSERFKIGSRDSLIDLIPADTDSRRSSRLLNDWSITLVAFEVSSDVCDLCRSSWISEK